MLNFASSRIGVRPSVRRVLPPTANQFFFPCAMCHSASCRAPPPPAFCCSVSIHPPTQSGVATNTRNGNDVFAAAVNCAELSLKFEVPEKERAIQTMDEASILPGRQSNRLNFPLNVRSCFPFRFSSLEETSIWNMTRSHTEVCPKRKFVCNDRKFCSLERPERVSAV